MSGRSAFRHALLMFVVAATSATATENVSSPPAEVGGVAQSTGSVTPQDAARFLSQATLGANWEEIHRTAEMGLDAWLDEQFEKPIGLHSPALETLVQQGQEVMNVDRRHVWWDRVMTGPDPLRQRIALALNELLVISDQQGQVRDSPQGAADYYDMLLANAFGNYHDLLLDVTLHPMMGVYLSHLRNERSDPSRGRFPDENFAREIMQLFSIGLFELNSDGSLRLDGAGQPIPTYDNDDITELAKVFTGMSFDSPGGFSDGTPNWTSPMRMFQPFHEPGPKQLLRGRSVPPGQTGMQDVEDAVESLFDHPNVGPFVSRRLIQRLVTSNPSPAYLERVASVFDDNGAGIRGDMKAVIRAILLDDEARRPPLTSDIHRGRLLESYLRRVQLARAFDARNFANSFPISDNNADDTYGQLPMSSPTVFNFFLPDHQPRGEISDADLVAPEFQIVTAVTTISSANALQSQIEGTLNNDPDDFLEVRMNLSSEIAVASDVRALVDRLDLLLTAGDMSPAMRAILIEALEQLNDNETRVQMALHLISISPEFNVHQ